MSKASTGKTSKTHRQPRAPRQEQQPKAVSTNSQYLKYGNQDSDEEYDLSSLRIKPDHYVVRHFGYMSNSKGKSVEDESSSRIQIYDKETFDRLNKQSVKDGKQIASYFEQQGLGVDVLHEPE